MDVSNETFGSDPFKGERKTLQVVFDTPNGGFKRDFDEGDYHPFWKKIRGRKSQQG
jgi:hypothetical protein